MDVSTRPKSPAENASNLPTDLNSPPAVSPGVSEGYEVLEIQFYAATASSAAASDSIKQVTNNPLQATGAVPVNGWLCFADGSQAALTNRTTRYNLDDVRFSAQALTIVTCSRIEHASDELARLQTLLESGVTEPAAGQVRSLLMTLQGAHILWHPTRVAVVASPQRLPGVVQAIVEATWRESQLRSLESALDSISQLVSQDAPLAFEFSDRHIFKRPELAQRFQAILALRMLSVNLSQHVLVPHVYPPTLASQITERLRERTRMAERLELAQVKLEAQERVYDLCSQRVSDFMLARQGHHLEWAIIIILLVQTVLVIIELLSTHTN